MGEGAQGHQLGQSAAQRESMGTGHAAAAEASKNTIAAQDAAAAQKRWRAFASKVAAARRPRSVAAQRIVQGLTPVGRVVVRARSTAQRVDVVRTVLSASDAWARGTIPSKKPKKRYDEPGKAEGEEGKAGRAPSESGRSMRSRTKRSRAGQGGDAKGKSTKRGAANSDIVVILEEEPGRGGAGAGAPGRAGLFKFSLGHTAAY